MGQYVERSKAVGYREFLAYETVRRSGKTNMFDIPRVIELSDGVLAKEQVRRIMVNFVEFKDLYPVDECPECERVFERDVGALIRCPDCDAEPDYYVPDYMQERHSDLNTIDHDHDMGIRDLTSPFDTKDF